ncbi:SWI/SNF and RSC complexes subunit ssr4 [Pseudocercospora fuligena]|uniref:SWI/SNF and RSC complexes subunit ssr4 n=1 Tax=Pseudocercospora fuligena TaxID=685502 RepID=A0A8H6VHI4_9PEZI|nr:SWI/SNF and RSC complexes subunit ssr4 [Pseudocercospora fuligena]
MNNPSQGVAPQLQPHVHLCSQHRFPVVQSLDLRQAFRYLIDAPAIVKHHASMAWEYLSAPNDGRVWLEWIPREKNEYPYPSDGYVWGDMEQSYRQDFNGYTIELKVQGIGYRPGHDQMATHARTRYHFVGKNPSVNAPMPDDTLWIVHYHQAAQHQIMPAAQVPVSPQMQQIISQRRWLESQGRLDRRDFMLHDREHWPIINIPGHGPSQQQGQYAAQQAAQNRPYGAYPQQAGQPPSKRPRTQGPGAVPGSSDGVPDTSIEAEEDTALGDYFDHLTQRDISLARYTQHHRWMEEVFSSPYASSNIVPPDLGLGLMGELKGLTEGILEPPDMEVRDVAERPAKAKEPAAFTNLKKEQVDEFSKRVAKHLEEGQAEIERMKAKHAAKMQDWKKVKALTQAEKRLRFASWEVHEDQPISVFRLEADPAVNGNAEEGLGKENVEDVVKEVESLLKVNIKGHQDATRISKGGLKDRKPVVFNYDQQANQQDTTFEGMTDVQQQQSTATSTPGANGAAAGETTTYHGDPTSNAQTPAEQDVKAPSTAQTTYQPGSTLQTPSHTGTPQNDSNNNTAGEALEDMPGMDMNDMVMDGMDMDVDQSNIDFGDTPGQDLALDDGGTSSLNITGTETTNTATAAAGAQSEPSAAPAQQPPAQDQPVESGLGDMGGDFNDTFGDILNNDSNGDDGLIDFEGGMDDSAFGDALHGMDSVGGSGEGNTPAQP